MYPKQQQDPDRRARLARTADMLARSGLLDVAMRTADLMRRNQQLEREIAQLKAEADAFVADVLSNPENAHLRAAAHSQFGAGAGAGAGNGVRVGLDSNMDLALLVDRGGGRTTIERLQTRLETPLPSIKFKRV